jgi:hypothetical protein
LDASDFLSLKLLVGETEGRAFSGPAFFVLAHKSYKMGSGLGINSRAPCSAGNPSTGSGQGVQQAEKTLSAMLMLSAPR